MFSGCSALASIIFPPSLTTINSYAFSGSGLTSVTIPSTITSLGLASATNGFQNCTSLTSVTFLSILIRTIPTFMFSGCSSLTSIEIPSVINTIGANAFEKCSVLTNINVDSNNTTFSSINGVLFNKAQSTLIQFPGGISDSYTIPTTVRTINSYAFSGSKITSIIIPSTITAAGFASATNGFQNCTSLTSVTFSNTVITTIPTYMFSGCTSLTSITFPTSLSTINAYAFSGSGLTSVTIPTSISAVGFASATNGFQNCTALTSVTFLSTAIRAIPNYMFSGCTCLQNCTIPNVITSIGINAFSGSGLTSIIIPNSITSIGVLAFQNCNLLTNINVNISNQNYSSLDGVLFNKTKTTLIQCPGGISDSYIIPSFVTNIGENAFQGCTLLNSIKIPNSVTNIGANAFQGCNSLLSITIPDSVTEAGFTSATYGFQNCTSLTSIIFTSTSKITTIPTYMFDSCSALTSIIIPKLVTEIQANAFQGCTLLKNVYFLGTNISTIAANNFTAANDTVYYMKSITSGSTLFSMFTNFIVKTSSQMITSILANNLGYQLVEGGITINSLLSSGFTLKNISEGGVTTTQLYSTGITTTQLIDSEIILPELVTYNINIISDINQTTINFDTTQETIINNNNLPYTLNIPFSIYNFSLKYLTVLSSINLTNKGYIDFLLGNQNIFRFYYYYSINSTVNTIKYYTFSDTGEIYEIYIYSSGSQINSTNGSFEVIIRITSLGTIEVFYKNIGPNILMPIIGVIPNNVVVTNGNSIVYNGYDGFKKFVQNDINGKKLTFDLYGLSNLINQGVLTTNNSYPNLDMYGYSYNVVYNMIMRKLYAPDIPFIINVTTTPEGTATINFTQQILNLAIVTGYKVIINVLDEGNVFLYNYNNILLSETINPLIITELPSSTTYSFKIQAVSAINNHQDLYSSYSNTVNAFVDSSLKPPVAPTITNVIGQNNTATIDFTQIPIDNTITNYAYSTDGTTFTDLNPSNITSPLIITDLTNGSTYSFTIRAYNGLYSLSSNTINNVFIDYKPTTPVITSATGENGTATINFTQTTNVSVVAITNYAYSTDGITFTDLNPTNITSPLIITGLTNGSIYSLTIRAYNGLYSLSSNTVNNILINYAQPAPVITSATGVNGTATINLTQTTNVGATTITNYAYSTDGITFTDLSPVQTGSLLIIQGLTNGLTYSFIIRAYNGFYSTSSNNYENVLINYAQPAPVITSATGANGNVTINLSQTTNVGAADITNYAYSTDGTTFILLSPTQIGSLLTIPGFTNGTIYALTIRAYNELYSISSNTYTNILINYPQPAPVITSATGSNGTATINFTQTTNVSAVAITNYAYSTDGTTFTDLNPIDITSPLIITDLTNGSIYSLTIRAYNGVYSLSSNAFNNVLINYAQPAPVITSATGVNGTATINFTQTTNVGAASITYYAYSTNGTTFTNLSTTNKTSPLTITGLTNGLTYSFIIRAYNGFYSDSSNILNNVLINYPQPAPNITAGNGINGNAIITFTQSKNVGATDITNYAYSTNNGVTFTDLNPPQTTSPLSILGLTTGTTYGIRIRAYNELYSNSSNNFTNIFINYPQSAPVITNVIGSNNTATIHFTQDISSARSITNYAYSTDGITFTDLSPAKTVSPLIISGLINGLTYSFTIKAFNGLYSPVSNTFSNVFINSPQPAPTITTVTGFNDTTTIEFTQLVSSNSLPITSYAYSTNDGSTFTNLTNPFQKTSPLTITGLTIGQGYTFRIRAYNGLYSLSSNSVYEYINMKPNAPVITNVIGQNNQAIIYYDQLPNSSSPITSYSYTTNNGNTFINLQLSNPFYITNNIINGSTYSFGIRAYNGEYYSDLSNIWSNVFINSPQPAPNITKIIATNNSATIYFTQDIYTTSSQIINYAYYINGQSEFININSSQKTSPLTITGLTLTNGNEYYFIIRAYNGLDSDNSNTYTVFMNYPPPVPVIISASGSNGRAIINFTQETNNARGIINYAYSIDNGTTFTNLFPNRNWSPLSITDLTNGATYSFKIRAYNGEYYSDSSNSSNDVFINYSQPAPIITSITGSNGNITVYFTQNINTALSITSYDFWISGQTITIGINSSQLIELSSTFTSKSYAITFSGYNNGFTYGIIITAYNSLNSDSSKTMSVFINYPPPAPVIASITSTTSGVAKITFSVPAHSSSRITQILYATDQEITENTIFSTSNLTQSGNILTITGLTNLTTYSFTLKSYNGLYSDASNMEWVYINFPPAAPFITSIVGLNQQAIVNFNQDLNGSSEITTYAYTTDSAINKNTVFVDINQNGNNSITISKLSSSIRTSLSNGATYSITLKSYNSFYSTISNTVSVYINSPAPAPFIRVNNGIVSSNGRALIDCSQSLQYTGKPITNYAVYVKKSNESTAEFKLLNPPQVVFPLSITGLVSGASYQFAVQAFNGLYSLSSNFKTATIEFAQLASVITSASGKNGSATIIFTQSNNGSRGIAYFLYSMDATNFTIIDSSQITYLPNTNNTSISLKIDNLTNGTSYSVTLKSYNGLFSEVSNALDVFIDSSQPAPTITSVTGYNGSALINFTQNNNGISSAITNYAYSINNNDFITFNPAQFSSPLTINGLQNGKTYPFQIKAINNGLYSDVSNSVSNIIDIVNQALNDTVFIRQLTPYSNIQYSIDNMTTWENNIYWPFSIGNINSAISTTNLVVSITTDLYLTTPTNVNDFTSLFVINENKITVDGNEHNITINDYPNFSGLIQNGSNNKNGYSNIKVKNINIITSGTTTLNEGQGWICSTYFGYASNNILITDCSSNGPITKNSGGIIGSYIAINSTNFIIQNCSAHGDIIDIGEGGGGIVGAYSSVSTISNQTPFSILNCIYYGNMYGLNSGGIIGAYSNNVQITECSTSGIIYSGGIVGSHAGKKKLVTITSCYSSGAIGNPYNFAGGIVSDYAENVTVTRCYTTGAIGGYGKGASGGIIGGYAGNNGNNGAVNIISCFSAGNIYRSCGGIAAQYFGINAATGCNISNCYSIGNIEVNGGGIVSYGVASGAGYNVIIENCYSLGSLQDSSSGGIVAKTTNTYLTETKQLIIKYCYSYGVTTNGNGIIGYGSTIPTIQKNGYVVSFCYSANGKWSNTAATNSGVIFRGYESNFTPLLKLLNGLYVYFNTIKSISTKVWLLGYSVYDLYSFGYTLSELKAIDVNLPSLKTAGFTSYNLVNAGYSVSDVFTAGYPILDLIKLEYTITQILAGGYKVKQLLDIGYSVDTLIDNGLGIEACFSGGCSLISLRNAGYSTVQIIATLDKFSNTEIANISNNFYPSILNLLNAGYLISDFSPYTTSALEMLSGLISKMAPAPAIDVLTYQGWDKLDLVKAYGSLTSVQSMILIAHGKGIEIGALNITVDEAIVYVRSYNGNSPYSAMNFIDSGYSKYDVARMSFTSEQLLAAGFTTKDFDIVINSNLSGFPEGSGVNGYRVTTATRNTAVSNLSNNNRNKYNRTTPLGTNVATVNQPTAQPAPMVSNIFITNQKIIAYLQTNFTNSTTMPFCNTYSPITNFSRSLNNSTDFDYFSNLVIDNIDKQKHITMVEIPNLTNNNTYTVFFKSYNGNDSNDYNSISNITIEYLQVPPVITNVYYDNTTDETVINFKQNSGNSQKITGYGYQINTSNWVYLETIPSSNTIKLNGLTVGQYSFKLVAYSLKSKTKNDNFPSVFCNIGIISDPSNSFNLNITSVDKKKYINSVFVISAPSSPILDTITTSTNGNCAINYRQFGVNIDTITNYVYSTDGTNYKDITSFDKRRRLINISNIPSGQQLITVKSYNGKYSEKSNSVYSVINAKPPAPIIVSIYTAIGTALIYFIQNSVKNVLDVNFYEYCTDIANINNSNSWKKLDQTKTPLVITGLEYGNGKKYSYVIRANNGLVSSNSNIVSNVLMNYLPEMPIITSVSGFNDNVSLIIDQILNGSNDVIDYEFTTDGINFSKILKTAEGALTFPLFDLPKNVKIRANNGLPSQIALLPKLIMKFTKDFF